MATAIEARGLGKRYQLGQATGPTTLIESVGRALARRSAPERPSVWALSELDLDIDEGEVVGVVGRNGAGKSTLLKILARITYPTTGLARTRGRLGALLEVGTAFHHELTGRENIAINGALLGMSKRDIQRRFDDIVAFSGVGAFLDTPVKRYSSGMYLRLAFSVAAHFEPDIIAVDEVLAVGDAEFQRRCLGKMSELGAEGRTVVFVSHDLGAIARLCTRAVWLDGGRLRDDGPAAGVIGRYLESTVPRAASARLRDDADADARLAEITLVAGDGSDEWPRRGEPLTVQMTIETRRTLQSLEVAVWVRDESGVRVLDEALFDDPALAGVLDRPGRHELALRLPGVLPAGQYVLGVWLGAVGGMITDEEVLRFDVRARVDDRMEMLSRARAASPVSSWHVASRVDRGHR